MFSKRAILGSELLEASRYLTLPSVLLMVMSACGRDLSAPDRAVSRLPRISASTASGFALISQLDSMSPQAVSFGRSLACAAGKRILGGGVENANYGVVMQETHPQPAGDAWTYAVSRKTGGATVTFTGWAVCADSSIAGYGLIAQQDTMGPSAVSFGRSLVCPLRNVVLGGGVENTNYGVVVQETYPKSTRDTWAYTVSRDTGGTSVAFTGRAICADSAVTGYVLVSRPDSMLPQAVTLGRSVPCPSGKRVFSGGVQNANYGVVVQESHPNAAGDTWAYTVARATGGATVRFTGWAVCAATTS
jgi:hypothetical protein